MAARSDILLTLFVLTRHCMRCPLHILAAEFARVSGRFNEVLQSSYPEQESQLLTKSGQRNSFPEIDSEGVPNGTSNTRTNDY